MTHPNTQLPLTLGARVRVNYGFFGRVCGGKISARHPDGTLSVVLHRPPLPDVVVADCRPEQLGVLEVRLPAPAPPTYDAEQARNARRLTQEQVDSVGVQLELVYALLGKAPEAPNVSSLKTAVLAWASLVGPTTCLPGVGCSVMHIFCAALRADLIAAARAAATCDIFTRDENGHSLLEAAVAGSLPTRSAPRKLQHVVAAARAQATAGNAARNGRPPATAAATAAAAAAFAAAGVEGEVAVTADPQTLKMDRTVAACVLALLRGAPVHQCCQLVRRAIVSGVRGARHGEEAPDDFSSLHVAAQRDYMETVRLLLTFRDNCHEPITLPSAAPESMVGAWLARQYLERINVSVAAKPPKREVSKKSQKSTGWRS